MPSAEQCLNAPIDCLHQSHLEMDVVEFDPPHKGATLNAIGPQRPDGGTFGWHFIFPGRLLNFHPTLESILGIHQ